MDATVNKKTAERLTGTTLSLVVPCFNEEAMLPVFYSETLNVLAKLSQENIALEFVFVDDGSTDKTLSILQNLSETDNRVHFVSFSRNFGKEAALLAGLIESTGQYVALMDADMQDPPSLIPSMLESVVSGKYDCAATRRVTRKGEPPIRSFFARRFYKIMSQLSDIEVMDGARDFRLMNRQYVDAIISMSERSRFSKGIFPWVGFKTIWFEYENIERPAGQTKWSFSKLFWYSLDGIIAFSTKPLAIASILGIVFFLVSLGFIFAIVIRRIIFGDPVAGWASTVCIILFCSGIQLFATGILGQYLARMYTEVKQRPHYIARTRK